jgi:hypothetical protein
MRRKATILDVLREAQGQGRRPPDPDREDAPDEEIGATEPVPSEPEEPRAGIRESVAEWMTTPVQVRRFAVVTAAAVILVALWAAFEIGASRGSGVEAAPRRKEPVARKTSPERMAGPSTPVVGGAKDPGKTTPAVATSDELRGFRIVTYQTSAKNEDRARAMRRHLDHHLAETGARSAWALEGRKKLVVAVAFPAERFEDKEWQDRLFTRIRSLPAPSWSQDFKFAALERSIIQGRLK